jgi:hypothetical protein
LLDRWSLAIQTNGTFSYPLEEGNDTLARAEQLVTHLVFHPLLITLHTKKCQYLQFKVKIMSDGCEEKTVHPRAAPLWGDSCGYQTLAPPPSPFPSPLPCCYLRRSSEAAWPLKVTVRFMSLYSLVVDLGETPASGGVSVQSPRRAACMMQVLGIDCDAWGVTLISRTIAEAWRLLLF